MNLNSKMLREIRTRQHNFEFGHHIKPIVLVIHPEFFYGIKMEIPMKIRPITGKAELYGMEINLSVDIRSNEFIIGEKFKVEVEE